MEESGRLGERKDVAKGAVRKLIAGKDAGVLVELPIFVVQQRIYADRVHGRQAGFEAPETVEVHLCVNDVHQGLQEGRAEIPSRSTGGARRGRLPQ